MGKTERQPSTYEVLRAHGIDRRDFLKFCTATAAAMGLEASMVSKVVAAMETKPRIPVIWLHGLECTCCSESFIRSSHPVAQGLALLDPHRPPPRVAGSGRRGPGSGAWNGPRSARLETRRRARFHRARKQCGRTAPDVHAAWRMSGASDGHRNRAGAYWHGDRSIGCSRQRRGRGGGSGEAGVGGERGRRLAIG